MSYITVSEVAQTQINIGKLVFPAQSGQIAPGSSATVLTGTGILAGSTLSTDSSSANAWSAFGRSFTQTSTATSGNNMGSSSSDEPFRADTPFRAVFNVAWSVITNIRFFIGLCKSSSLANIIDADTLVSNGVGIQFSTPRGDTNLQLIAFGGAQTTTNTGLAPVAATFYSIEFVNVNGTGITCNILNSAGALLYSGSITTNLPATTDPLFMVYAAEPESAAAITITHYSWSALNLGYVR